MATKLNPWGGRGDGYDGTGGLLTKLSRISTAQTTGARALGWMQALMDIIETFRNQSNPWEDGATRAHGTTQGTLPRIGAGGTLDIARLASTRPASLITSGTFAPSQIPRYFAGEVRPGKRNLTGRITNTARLYNASASPPQGLPARKINSGTLTDAQLPVGYRASRRESPTTFSAGGPGVQDSAGTTVGQNSWFVATTTLVDSASQVREQHRTQGTVSADGRSAKIQFRSDYWIRRRASACANSGVTDTADEGAVSDTCGEVGCGACGTSGTSGLTGSTNNCGFISSDLPDEFSEPGSLSASTGDTAASGTSSCQSTGSTANTTSTGTSNSCNPGDGSTCNCGASGSTSSTGTTGSNGSSGATDSSSSCSNSL